MVSFCELPCQLILACRSLLKYVIVTALASFLWELTAIKKHYHPTIYTMAKSVGTEHPHSYGCSLEVAVAERPAGGESLLEIELQHLLQEVERHHGLDLGPLLLPQLRPCRPDRSVGVTHCPPYV